MSAIKKPKDDPTFKSGEKIGRTSDLPQHSSIDDEELRHSSRSLQQSEIASLGRFALHTDNWDLLLEETTKRTAHVLRADFSTIFRLSNFRDKLILISSYGWSADQITKLQFKADLNNQAGFSIASGFKRPVFVDDWETEERFTRPPAFEEAGIMSGITVLIGSSSRKFGVLSVHSKRKRLFSANESQFMQATANILASASAYNETVKVQRLLIEIGDAARKATSPEALMKRTGKLVRKRLEFSASCFFESSADDEISSLLIDHATNYGRTPFVLNDARNTGVAQEIQNRLSSEPVGTLVVIPVFNRSTLISYFVVANPRPRIWLKNEITLLRTIVERTWSSVEQMHSEAKLKRAHKELEKRVDERTRQLADANKVLREENRLRKSSQVKVTALLRKLVVSEEMERRKLGSDLHDHLGQQLTALRLGLRSLRTSLDEDNELVSKIRTVENIAGQIDTDVSFLSWTLRPAALEKMGLREALINYVEQWSRHFKIETKIHAPEAPKLDIPEEVEVTIYRVTQEILNNAIKHSKADKISFILKSSANETLLIVEDNGTGFEQVISTVNGRSMGLRGMEERMSMIGGTIEFESAIGRGTAVFVRVPISQKGKNEETPNIDS
ncbi:MAG: GAF domain-containing protein [Pyrinomonadaceae bacterium]|nr:GAF domain-containing protein [Pyrinomonadaceae bacterium]